MSAVADPQNIIRFSRFSFHLLAKCMTDSRIQTTASLTDRRNKQQITTAYRKEHRTTGHNITERLRKTKAITEINDNYYGCVIINS
jgi:hypothetical protein